MRSRFVWVRRAVVGAVALSTATVWSVTFPTAASAAVVVPEACRLLSPSDLQGVLGVTFGKGSPTDTPSRTESACTWIHASNSSRGFSVLLEAQGLGISAFRDARATAKGGKYNPYDTKFRTIKHLGDEAFSHQHRYPGFPTEDDVVVRKGEVTFSFVASTKQASVDALKQLAVIVLTRV